MLFYRLHISRVQLCHPQQEVIQVKCEEGKPPLEEVYHKNSNKVMEEDKPHVIEGVKRLLVDQQRGLDDLTIRGPRAFALLEEGGGIADMGGCKVKCLNLVRICWRNVKGGESYIWVDALKSGAFKGVQELNLLDLHPLLITSLGEAGCPQLRSLGIYGDCEKDDRPANAAHALVHALESGHLNGLEELRRGIDFLGHFAVVAKAIAKAGPFPNLTTIRVDDEGWYSPQPADLEALAEMVASGACPNLKELPISISGISDQHLITLVHVLQAGSCPGLTELSLADSEVGVEGATALSLGRLLVSGSLPNLKIVNLNYTRRTAMPCLDY